MTSFLRFWLWWRTFWIKTTKPGRRYRIRQACKVLEKVRAFPNDAVVLSYLRKINPYVFEELVLECLGNGGWLVWHTPSYSGDGGIDGKVYAPGIGWFYIQSKRYGGTIRPEHVADFVSKVGKKHGLFVHTGRTGEASRLHLHSGERVFLISGSLLVALIRTPERVVNALDKKYR